MIEEEYLSVLSKIMGEESEDNDYMNRLYHIIDEELYSSLEEVKFPSMPELSGRLDQMLLSLNALLICPEILNKEVIAIYNHYTSESFGAVEFELKNKDYRKILKKQTQIPIVLLNSDNLNIEVINNSFARVTLTQREYVILLEQSNKNRIALNRLVKFIVIKVPMNNPNKCYLLDNTYRNLSMLFEELICSRVYKITEADIKYLKPWYFMSMDYLLCGEKEFKKITELGLIDANGIRHIVNLSAGSGVFRDKCAIVSFLDVLMYSVCPMLSYYNNNIKNLENMLTELKNDAIRDENVDLSKFNDEINLQLRAYKESKEVISSILWRLEKEVKEIDKKNETVISRDEQILTKFLKDCMFTYYFSIAGIGLQEEKDCIKRLLNFGYEYQDLLISYSKSVNGSRVQNPEFQFGENCDWECAKMILHFSESDKCTDTIKEMVLCLGKDRLSTGKEWYYWHLLHNDENALKTSVQLGCDMANKKLFAEGNDNPAAKNMLISVLYPDACIERGKEDSLGGDTVIKSIDDKRLAYLKIAAAIGDNRGSKAIVDILYQNVIWSYFSKKGVPLKDDNTNADFVDVCGVVFALCNHLISQKIDKTQNSERLAIINFCLNRNLSEVYNIFYNKASDAAYYCKGYLAEYGLYVGKNLDKAIAYYEKVDSVIIPAVKNAKKRVLPKIVTQEKNKKEEYDEGEDYSGYSSSYIADSSWCFITTAASCALKKGRDCDELNFLRKFRDEYIKGTAEGNALVNEYYNIAPKLIEKIDLEENASDIYAGLWVDYIVPSVEKITQGKWQEAQDIYVAMVVDLSKKYHIEINTEGYEDLYHSTLRRIGYEE